MGIHNFEGRVPRIHSSSYIFPTATVIGDVTIGEQVWVGPGAVLRGDYGTIVIDDFSAVEDNCVVHARPGEKTTIGKHVTLGHGCVIHTSTIQDWAIIGMKAVVSDFAEVGVWAVVAEGAVVPNRVSIPSKAIAAGVPAKVIGSVSDEYISLWTTYKQNYNSFCKRYPPFIEGAHQK
jgi:phenylacetic acid degradation protein